MAETTIVWFRHDLRLDDNPSLARAASLGRVIPLFIWAPEEEDPWSPGAASRWWLHGSLLQFQKQLAKLGAPLVIRRGPSLDTLRSVAKSTHATRIHWNRRHEPAVVERDTKIKATLTADGIVTESFGGGLLYEPATLATKEGKPYQVFTPFWRACLSKDEPALPLSAPRSLDSIPEALSTLSVESLRLLPSIDWAEQMRTQWTPGEAGAQARWNAFLTLPINDYGLERDRPDHRGTSSLSPHLHFGEISPRRLWHSIRDMLGGISARCITGGAEVFLREIGWREFASHLLYHFPHTSDAPLRCSYENFPWRVDPVGLRAWQRGRTGFPIVDAGMRQLWQTGWMHNRVRMIVASFLVKDLLVSWNDGARWFWDTLVDADLASNTLGWQWAGGCGADAAPYFRVFNPTSQGNRFDPDGTYVRRFIPELHKLPTSSIHAPQQADAATLFAAEVRLGDNYPEPYVDHAEARLRALSALKTVSQKSPPPSTRMKKPSRRSPL